MPTPLLVLATLASTAMSLSQSLKGQPKPPLLLPPEAPTLADPAIAAARRRQLSATAGRGRGSTIIAGKNRRQVLETENQTLLGGAGA